MILDLISGGTLVACVVGIANGMLYLRTHAKLVDACAEVRRQRAEHQYWHRRALELQAEKRLPANKRKSAACHARHAQMEHRKALVTQKTAELRKEIAA